MDWRACNVGAPVEAWEHALIELGRRAGYKSCAGSLGCVESDKKVHICLGMSGGSDE